LAIEDRLPQQIEGPRRRRPVVFIGPDQRLAQLDRLEEARASPGVAGRTVGRRGDQQGVAVTVDPQRSQLEGVAAALALLPESLLRPAEEGDLASRQR